MSSRSRALLSLAALAALALPAAATWLRVTQFFFADFDLKSGPGQPLPLAAEKGTLVGAAPTFTVVPQAVGGALLVTGGGPGSPSASLDAIFDKVFNGTDLTIGWTMTPGAQSAHAYLRCMEDTDGEIIDCGWDGNGGVEVGGLLVGTIEPGQSYACSLTLRDNLVGPDTWVFTIQKVGAGVPATTTGVLALSHPLTVTKLQVKVEAGSVGTTLLDDLVACSSGFGQSK